LNLLIKERLDLVPHLRDLDTSIENIELGLRRTIEVTLMGDSALIPDHIMCSVDERASKSRKKSAMFDADRYSTLAGRLEFFDLRELQDLIQNKALWDKFQVRFLGKEAFASKINQLAELRNGIRHSRAVDEVTRKEGEAAILWFDQVLKKHV